VSQIDGRFVSGYKESMENEPSDIELMTAYIGGDENAFTTLFGRYSSKLTNFLRYRLGARRKQIGEEIFQKTWMKLHKGRKSYDPSQKFSTWFYTIALNCLRDEVGSAYEKAAREEVSENRADDHPNSEDQYISKETFRQIEALFKFLTDRQKTALLLSDQEELSSNEIAAVMEISDVAARQLVSRARKIIRTHFKQETEKTGEPR
jgi:RNA polymerase sigma-70 factor (ECF subfamily)